MTERSTVTLSPRDLRRATAEINAADQARVALRSSEPSVGMLYREIPDDMGVTLRVGELLYHAAVRSSHFRDAVVRHGESVAAVFGGVESNLMTPQMVLGVVGERTDQRTVDRVLQSALRQAKGMSLNGVGQKVRELILDLVEQTKKPEGEFSNFSRSAVTMTTRPSDIRGEGIGHGEVELMPGIVLTSQGIVKEASWKQRTGAGLPKGPGSHGKSRKAKRHNGRGRAGNGRV